MDQLIAKGLELKDNGDYDGALRALDKALYQDPSNAHAYYERAQTLRERADSPSGSKTGGHQEAAINLELCLMKIKGNTKEHEVELWFLAGYCYGMSEWHKDALRCLSNGIAIDPCHVGCLSTRAIAFSNLYEYENAIRDCNAVLKLKPDHSDAQRLLDKNAKRKRDGYLPEAETRRRMNSSGASFGGNDKRTPRWSVCTKCKLLPVRLDCRFGDSWTTCEACDRQTLLSAKHRRIIYAVIILCAIAVISLIAIAVLW
jgi:tetratricopeptide (TPR) repeat protein